MLLAILAVAGGCDALHKGRARTGPLRCARSQRKAGKRPRLLAGWALAWGMRRTRESVESVAASSSPAARRLMARAGIDGGDEAVRNGAAQDDLFAALLYQHSLAC